MYYKFNETDLINEYHKKKKAGFRFKEPRPFIFIGDGYRVKTAFSPKAVSICAIVALVAVSNGSRVRAL